MQLHKPCFVGFLCILQLQISYSVYVPKIMTVGWQHFYCKNKLAYFFVPPCSFRCISKKLFLEFLKWILSFQLAAFSIILERLMILVCVLVCSMCVEYLLYKDHFWRFRPNGKFRILFFSSKSHCTHIFICFMLLTNKYAFEMQDVILCLNSVFDNKRRLEIINWFGWHVRTASVHCDIK